ncbi:MULTISPECIES: quinohemoprotein amine dehydrogenase subunit alpha [Burkholderia]|uniref:quinohemoprotein amine dehydrogenase subunit alpha n=1 Tax=Burkholderia TaxID=32008 RepID=UPI000BF859AC|nr:MULTISPECIES: quinohemoprotein amine dehydrogenase subunit alpha [Burkholderia]PFH19868.1 quinohemoprotein amine dehydrogenase [Burkholderia sp. JKS000303]
MFKTFIRRSRPPRAAAAVVAAGALALASGAVQAQAQAPRDAHAILSQTCAACHAAESKDSWSRISHQRKTPEGWLMTIARMQTMHGLTISDDERRILVKYLSDTQGLAPSETKDFRYAPERRLNTQEIVNNEEFKQMCARCHSAARPLLQRRPVAEWDKLVNFHLGQWPSIEYSAMGRDRDWFKIALTEMAPMLAKDYPYDSKAWTDWKRHHPPATALAGTWSFGGHMPGKGDAYGTMTVKGGAGDRFDVELKGRFADGSPLAGTGTAVLYTGYEWRASVKVGDTTMRQVLMASDGTLHGRMFDDAHDERGLDFNAAKLGNAQIVAVQPAYVKAGGETDVTIVGANLQGTPAFGAGVTVASVLERTPEYVRVRVKAADGSAAGARRVSVGAAHADGFAVYREIRDVKVEPDFAVARIGGNGGSTPKVEGRFDAVAWGVDAAGKPFRIGVVPAQWSVAPFDDQSKRDRDTQFAGAMQASTGIFTPGNAGPNPARRMGTNNTGNLNVVATVTDGSRTVTGTGHMIVAVQRWNNPPLP